ncbi:unnamed protein product [Candidula unifasciata]|uniref:Uncharacterized protein n=1 Tax=Candidula unifasciata TaxID=100452 RepID=A0A8S3YUG8_9EUPU|nr:unnamed protein product [Candidula unifasciata]
MCLNIASKAHSFEPMKDSHVKWYQVLVPNTDFAEIEAVSEEFLHLIKGCPLLPSWMTNLARMSRVNNNNRAMPLPSRGPGVSSVSAPSGGRQNPPGISSTAGSMASGNVPTTASTASLPQNYPSRPQATATSLTSAQVTDSRQLSSRAAASQLQNEAVISPGSRHISAETGASGLVPGASDAHVKDSVPSSHSRQHPSSCGAQMRPHHPSAALPSGAVPHQQHRAHPPGNGRPANQTVAPVGGSSSRPPTKPSMPVNPQVVRPPQHPGQPGHHPTSHQSSRPAPDQVRHQDAGHTRDQSRPPFPDVLKGQRDHARSRDSSRPHDSLRLHDTARHGHPDQRPDVGGDARHIPHSDSSLNRSQSSRPEHISQRHSTVSPNTPPTNTPTAVSLSPPEPPSDISQILSSSGETQDISINVTSDSPENQLKLQSNPDKQQSAASHGPKLSLRMYRERTVAKSKTSVDQTTPGDIASAVASITDDSYTLGVNPESATNSPGDVSLRLGSGELANFHKPQDSPSNPRIKIKVKRDPSSGERHAVKYAETGLKIKIKPIRSDTPSGAESGDAGPSGVGMASSASTPREEGEIVEDTPPSSGDSEQKSERLRIRLSVPKSDQSLGFNRRESDQGSNGHSGEHDQGHRSHHHSHHRSHHHSKSKKHSKHDRSRHEVRSVSKRSASALDYHDERPSKTSRPDTHFAATGHVSHHTGYSDRSHQQNTGFSIHDAFSTTMPHNIFDDDDDPTHTHPPVTPTVETVPPHHERFHQLMAQHRAKVDAVKKPPLPRGPPPPRSSPPPPPPSPPIM